MGNEKLEEIIEMTQEILEVSNTVARGIVKDDNINEWRENLSKDLEVVKEGIYYRRGLGLEKKLNASRWLIEEIFCRKYHLLKPKGSKEFDYGSHRPQAVDTNTIAKLIRWAYSTPKKKIPLSKILFSNEELKKFLKKDPKKGMDKLFNAYEGVSWFENFKAQQRKKPKRWKPRPLVTSQELGTHDIPAYFGLEYTKQLQGFTKHLYDAGFITFKGYSGRKKVVDIENFAHFLARLYNKDLDEILIEDNSSSKISYKTPSSSHNPPKPSKKRLKPEENRKERIPNFWSVDIDGLKYKVPYSSIAYFLNSIGQNDGGWGKKQKDELTSFLESNLNTGSDKCKLKHHQILVEENIVYILPAVISPGKRNT